jgi:hypothetical protein
MHYFSNAEQIALKIATVKKRENPRINATNNNVRVSINPMVVAAVRTGCIVMFGYDAAGDAITCERDRRPGSRRHSWSGHNR